MISVDSAPLFVGSFPPRQCGIATFTQDLIEHVDRELGSQSDVIAIEDVKYTYSYGPRVVDTLAQSDHASYYRIASLIKRHPCSVVNLQHEFGLFGGEHGEWCVDLIQNCGKPVVLTLHTVLPQPSPRHFEAVRRLCKAAASVIILSESARQLLTNSYGIPAQKVEMVHHGVPDAVFQSTAEGKMRLGLGKRKTITTFGLLSSGKGLENAISALYHVAQNHPDVLYLVLGATHPVVKRREGEAYRESLQRLVRGLGLQKNVVMIDRFLSLDELIEYLQATDIYLSPYRNPNQVVSGTLAYAVAMGTAVVSTPYLYACEMLACNRGILVDFGSPISIARALARLVDEPLLRAEMRLRAFEFGRQMRWPVVAGHYARIFSRFGSASSAALAK